MRERIMLNNGWRFTEQFAKELLLPDFDENSMTEVRLPHTVKETPFHYFDEHCYQMVSGYRKKFTAKEEWKGKKVLLTIDGAAHDAEVWINGEKTGEHHCGYTAFTMDITKQLVFGAENLITVRLDSREDLNVPPFGFVVDYLTYGGLTREVWLTVCDEVQMEDVFVYSRISDEALKHAAEASAKAEGRETQVLTAEAELVTELTVKNAKDGCLIRQSIRKRGEEEFRLLGEQKLFGEQATLCFLLNAELWDTEHPVLYEVKTQVLYQETVLDELVTTTGIRRAEFQTDGFYINGRKRKLRGLNRHQSFPYVGYAMPESMQKLDADILKKELGVNAVRTSHYPQSHHFLDRCDEIGLFVFTEIPGWQHIGDAAWKEQAVENVREMILQYRNHPSIILWGVRINESEDDDEFYARTNAVAHELDGSRQTGGVRANKRSSLLEDVYTYNDFVHNGEKPGCEPKAAVTSDKTKPYLVSEYNGHMYPTKSFDCEEHRLEHALRHVRVLEAVAREEDIAGSFGWCMFDYNTHKDFGSGDRICYHGVLDMFRNPKLAAAVYACGQKENTVLELSSSMDIGEHPASSRGDIYIFTNADSVRMYKNDRFIKEYIHADSTFQSIPCGPILVDDFIGDALKEEGYSGAKEQALKKVLNTVARCSLAKLPKSIFPTVLKLLVVYRMKMSQAVDLYTRHVGDWGGASTVYRFEAVRDGRVVKTIVKSPMTKVALVAEADHKTLFEGSTYDVAAVRIRAVDEHGNVLPFFHEPVKLSIETLPGDNAAGVDAAPLELIGPDTIVLQGGMGGTYVKTTGETGTAVLKIAAAQAEPVTIMFQCKGEGK
ncbi:MAG: glycoside hydrolase family 2 TIM barrel-domain containing protein [Lachnospiraceae bacterium]